MIKGDYIKLILLILTINVCSKAQSQFKFVSLASNPALKNQKIQDKLESRNMLFYYWDMPAGKTKSLDIDTAFVSGRFKKIVLSRCSSASFGTYTVDQNKITYSSNLSTTVKKDTLCLQVFDDSDSIVLSKLVLTIRPIQNLPFFDDFTYDSIAPDQKKWTDRNVFVNRGMGINPPSYGVATFDGLDETGISYGQGQGVSDYLSSSFIDLLPSSGDSLFLTFYLQAKGYGLQPYTKDSIVIDFLGINGIWKSVLSIPGLPNTISTLNSPPFYFYKIYIPNGYKQDAFRFRFKNYSPRTGMTGLWHLDHVKIAKSEDSGKAYDLAFNSAPDPVFKNYSAIPIHQLKGKVLEELADSTRIRIRNNYSSLMKAENSELLFNDLALGQPLAPVRTLLEVPPVVASNQRDLDTGSHFFHNKIELNNLASALEAKIGALSKSAKYTFEKKYSYTQNLEALGGFTGYFSNNVVALKTTCSNYFAHDDGSAELGLAVNSDNAFQSSLAVKYHANQLDTLKEIQILIPNIATDVATQDFKLSVYLESLSNTPIYNGILYKPIHSNNTTPEGFSVFALKDSQGKPIGLNIPSGDFYIAFQQITITTRDNAIPLGYDRNNAHFVKSIYYNTGAGWKDFASVSAGIDGALMIRPVFGKVPLVNKTKQIITAENINVYPNPTSAILRIDCSEQKLSELMEYRIYDIYGNLALNNRFSSTEIEVHTLNAGIYFLQLVSKNGEKSMIKFIKD